MHGRTLKCGHETIKKCRCSGYYIFINFVFVGVRGTQTNPLVNTRGEVNMVDKGECTLRWVRRDKMVEVNTMVITLSCSCDKYNAMM